MNITHGSILAVFFTASEAEKHEGLSWYARANIVANRLATTYDVPGGVVTVAGVLAALSPNNRWERNVADAERLIKAYACGDDTDAVKVCTFSKNKDKAVAILQGEQPLKVLGGNKVRAFFECIAYPTTDAVCVDGHAYSIWLGQRVPTTKTPSISDKLYDHIANDYKLAAKQINSITGEYYSPSQVQAITWVTWRNIVNSNK